jgi:hypothetical protein
MRSSAARLTLGAAAWIAFGAAAAFIVQSEQQLTGRREAVRLFDVRAGDAAVALADARNAQQAYLVPGQGLGVWVARVDAFLKNATASLEELRQTAVDGGSRQALVDAAASVAELFSIDKRAREYLNSAQPLMAADVVFSEGLEMAATAGRQLETARIAEHVAWDSSETASRRMQAYSGGGAVLLAALVIAFLAVAPAGKTVAAAENPGLRPAATTPPAELEWRDDLALGGDDRSHTAAAPTAVAVSPEVAHESLPILQAAVDVCTDLNRARDIDDLSGLLGRAATVMDASGLIVWVGSAAGPTLRPVLAHGYSPQALARMPPVARSDSNAAAAAFRTGELQIVGAQPGLSSGALAAPMLSRDGCIGALTAEIKNGGEASPGVQAIAAILAAQLAGVLADSVPADDTVEESRIASA